jgi:uroporphyrinogen-III synthase
LRYILFMSFENARVLAFESRRQNEMAELIRLNGGQPLVAPTVVEVPLEANEQAFAFADRLYAGEFEMVIFLTGVGIRFLQRVIASRDDEERFPEALRKVTVVARGPKPSAVLKEWKVPITIAVPEPSTWRELIMALRGRPERTVAVQEYGRTNRELIEGLEAQGRTVTPVPVYQWRLPDDKGPLAEALDDLLAKKFKAALFTTGVQIEHFLEFAAERGERENAVARLSEIFIASIGPNCSESLVACGLRPALEPSHPKMGILVREAALAMKQTSSAAGLVAEPPRR